MQGYESFVSHEGLEQLHRFIFVMAVTHVTYSCLTMLLAILKVLTLYHMNSISISFFFICRVPFWAQISPLSFDKDLIPDFYRKQTPNYPFYQRIKYTTVHSLYGKPTFLQLVCFHLYIKQCVSLLITNCRIRNETLAFWIRYAHEQTEHLFAFCWFSLLRLIMHTYIMIDIDVTLILIFACC